MMLLEGRPSSSSSMFRQLRRCLAAAVLSHVILVALAGIAHSYAYSDAVLNVDDDVIDHHGNHQTSSDRGSATRNGGVATSGYSHTIDDYDELGEGHGVPCSSETCSNRELKRRYVYDSIRNDILRKLRFAAAPNITGRPTLPEIPELQDTIRRMCNQKDVSCTTESGYPPGVDRRLIGPGGGGGDDDDDSEPLDDFAQTLKVLLFPIHRNAEGDHMTGRTGSAHNPRQNTSAAQQSNVARFKIPSELHNNEIVNATFGVYVRRPTAHGRRPTWLLIYGRRGTADGPERLLIGKRIVNLTAVSGHTEAWYQIRIMPPVIATWLSRPSAHHDIEVQITDNRGISLAVIEPRSDEEQPFRPYLEIQVRAARQAPRSKRQLDDLNCDDLSLERRCCRYPLVVDFDAFGWDWVIVPRRYSAYYCSGECPFLYYRSADPASAGSHARQQQMPAGGGGPCCSPKKVSAISMLYYDDKMNILHDRLPGMVVEQCGCS